MLGQAVWAKEMVSRIYHFVADVEAGTCVDDSIIKQWAVVDSLPDHEHESFREIAHLPDCNHPTKGIWNSGGFRVCLVFDELGRLKGGHSNNIHPHVALSLWRKLTGRKKW